MISNLDGGMINVKRVSGVLEWTKVNRPHAVALTETGFVNAEDAKHFVEPLQKHLKYKVKCTFAGPNAVGTILAVMEDLIVDKEFVELYVQYPYEQIAFKLLHKGVKQVVSNSYIHPGTAFTVYRRMVLHEAQILGW